MFVSLGRFVIRWPRAILLATGVLTLLGAVAAGGLFDAISGGGFDNPAAQSTQADHRLKDVFGWSDFDVVAVYRSPDTTTGSQAFKQAVYSSFAEVPGNTVVGKVTPWLSGLSELRSIDRHAAAVIVQLVGDNEAEKLRNYSVLRRSLHADGFTIGYSGAIALLDEANTRTQEDLIRAEALALPLVFLLLVAIFRGVVAALLPTAVGLVTVVGGLAALRVAASLTEVSFVAVNIASMVAMGVAVDGALFFLNRVREERAAGASPNSGVLLAVATAGRTMFFSALAVSICFGGLMLFPYGFLWSLGLGGALAMAIGMVVVLTVLPALVLVLEHRVGNPRPRHTGHGWAIWDRLGQLTTRRPAACLVLAVTFLVLLALPALHIRFGTLDQRTLPADSAGRQTTEVLRNDFPDGDLDRIEVLTTYPNPVASPSGAAVSQAWIDELRALPASPHVHRVLARERAELILVEHAGSSEDPDSQTLVRQIRALRVPGGGNALVTGQTAATVDMFDALTSRAPWIAALVCSTTFVLLLFAFRSVVVPIKAILTNVLSIAASMGAITWIFQDGHLAGVLGFVPLGYIETSQPVICLAVLFGVSMDYELFLLSRVREEYDRDGDNAAAIVVGLRRTGGIITAAAVVLLTVVAAFSTGTLVAVKEVGVGLFVAVAVDATVVRLLLVPAALRLLGRANWWAPRMRLPGTARGRSDRGCVPAR